MSIYGIEVRAEPAKGFFRHWEVCWWNVNCCCLLSALGGLHLPASSTGLEESSAPPHTESRTSRGSEEASVRAHVATSVLSQSSLPALKMGEETTLSRRRNSSEAEFSWLHFSRTSASSPPSGHSAGEYPVRAEHSEVTQDRSKQTCTARRAHHRGQGEKTLSTNAKCLG